MRVAYFGAPGAFGEEAARQLGGADAQTLPWSSPHAVLDAVTSGGAELGVLPIENSRAGVVPDSLDALGAASLWVVAELELRIRHCLLARPGTALADVREARSHPQALAQSREFLERHGIAAIAAQDTASAARWAAEEAPAGCAAVASAAAGMRYGLEVLAADIQTDADNRTRFWALSREPRAHLAAAPQMPARTALLFQPRPSAGALGRALGGLAREGVEMVSLHTRPARLPGAAPLVFITVNGDPSAAAFPRALHALEAEGEPCRILGTFPAAGPMPGF